MDKKEFFEKVGKRIKLERVKRDLSQDDLSGLTNIHRNYISLIEKGKQNISLKKILDIANALKIEPYELLKFEKY